VEIRVYAHPPPTLCVRKCKFAPKLLNLFDPILILTHREYPASLLSEQLYCVHYYFVIKPTRCTNFSTRCNNFTHLFGMKLYMFRTVRLSIIRSLFTVHSAMVYVIQVCRQLSSRTMQVLISP